MDREALISIWKAWESSDNSSNVTHEDGRKFVWAFGVLFSKKVCHCRLCKAEINALKWAYLDGIVRFESEELELKRLACIQSVDLAA